MFYLKQKIIFTAVLLSTVAQVYINLQLKYCTVCIVHCFIRISLIRSY